MIREIAAEMGIPPELLAAVLNTERVFDTDWYDPAQSVYQSLVLLAACLPAKVFVAGSFSKLAFAIRESGEAQMFLWETAWKPGAPGVGPGLGLGHVHTGPAREVEAYFESRGLGDLLPAAESSEVLWARLLSDEGNIRYSAAALRRLLEIRQGGEWEYGQISAIGSVSIQDAEVIMDGYWWGVDSYGAGGYSLYEFQTVSTPKHDNGLLIDCSYVLYRKHLW